jgi:SagB-type dehydrogenase family enzyme
MIDLPQPLTKSGVSLEEAIIKRRSVRNLKDVPLTQEEISQLLWSAQGVTDKNSKYRSAPSAGARYPIELYALTQEGLFHYHPLKHAIEKIRSVDIRQKVSEAAMQQPCIKQAPFTVVIAANYAKLTSRYDKKGVRYADMEAGHIAQNVLLQAAALGLAGVPVGAFLEDVMIKTLDLPEDLKPIYLIPVGHY